MPDSLRFDRGLGYRASRLFGDTRMPARMEARKGVTAAVLFSYTRMRHSRRSVGMRFCMRFFVRGRDTVFLQLMKGRETGRAQIAAGTLACELSSL